MTRWERLEQFLVNLQDDTGGIHFTQAEYADASGLDGADATTDIQRYLEAQRSQSDKPLFVIRRETGTRTSNAVWLGGSRAVDMRARGAAFHDDVQTAAMRAFRPDLLRASDKNPRARRQFELQIETVLKNVMPLLELAATGAMARPDEDEE
jgi:hypothetical protein